MRSRGGPRGNWAATRAMVKTQSEPTALFQAARTICSVGSREKDIVSKVSAIRIPSGYESALGKRFQKSRFVD